MRVFLMLLLAALAAGTGLADTRLKGTVRDSSGTPIPGAMVLIHWDSAGSTAGVANNVGLKEQRVVRADASGSFSLDLPSGFYDVFVAAPTFTPTCRKIRMKVGEAQEISFSMNADPLYTAEIGNRVEIAPPKH